MTDQQKVENIRIAIRGYNKMVEEAKERGITVTAEASKTDGRLVLKSIAKEM